MEDLYKKFELLGMCVGDGCISVNDRYSEYALLGDMKEEREYYESHVIPLFNDLIMMPILNRKIVGKLYPKMGVFGFIVFNSKICEYFMSTGLKSGPKTKIKLPKYITRAKPELLKAFLRGLFDTDGSIYFEKNYSAKSDKHIRPKIKLGTTSETLKNQIKQMCKSIGIRVIDKKPYKGKRDKNMNYELVIYRKMDIEKWIKEVGFNNSKHTTKIQVWNKLGYCPPKKTINQRKEILKNKVRGTRFELVKALSHRISKGFSVIESEAF